jgi:excisionase family DNA binding protein
MKVRAGHATKIKTKGEVRAARASASRTGTLRSATMIPEAGGQVVEPRERLLTADDISARLFIKPRTAALWARQGRLPAYRIGRKLGFKWEEVEKALPKTKAEILKTEI